ALLTMNYPSRHLSCVLYFPRSSLPYPEPEGYEAFLTQLVCNLLDEGNTVFREGDWRQATVQYSEGVNVARYAQAEALLIPAALLESLYVNRAAAYYSLGEYEHAMQDCNSTLAVSEGSRKALYRKALCLRELGRLREAYESSMGCLLTAPHVSGGQGHDGILGGGGVEARGMMGFWEEEGWKPGWPRHASLLPFYPVCAPCGTPLHSSEVQEHQECKYGENCTFAYCQEEIDVWTQERKGALSRELLFDPLGSTERRALSVTRLLQQHMGMFMFLCEECFDSKPRIISKRSKENLAVCSNLTARHPFDDNKCLVHVVRSAHVRYCKVRPLHPLCQFDVCRHEVRYGCQREDSCSFAHSVIELKCWVLQQDTGITHEEMVQESKRHWHRLERNAQRQKVSGVGPRQRANSFVSRGLNLKMKFVCGQCWRDGQVNEPDKALKYCTAKARHSWTKERRVLLVKSFDKKKWVVVRPLPFSRTYPQQYDMCVHVMKQKKCHYIGNCSFAHSLEERDVWTYMKNNSLRDMQQMYDMWLALTNQNRRPDGTVLTPPPEEKQISMPTDYAEPMSGFHCRLCGKHSNSERQWQQHISSEKHKDRVFSCEAEAEAEGGAEDEDEGLAWSHRFPGPHFLLCPRLDGACPDGVSCDYAHSEEELAEWRERRDFLRRKLSKARDDMLIAPGDCDFGKYNFLLQD
uniref:Zinc finger CCCH-type containing 7B n=1 Tax=Paramormyrops kingsleyae TaxID=1676925 RepID=A0A3B3RHH6_9TELE